MALKKLLMLSILAGLSVACGLRPPDSTIQMQMDGQQTGDRKTYIRIQKMLDKTGGTLDYETLLTIFQTLRHPERPVAHLDHLIDQLIQMHNSDPRIDQMILIVAAQIIGSSSYPIADAEHLFEAILKQNDRLNEWVLAFVAEAIGDYPFALANGDPLVDSIELKLEQLQSQDRSQAEHFGFHFLPPPKTDFIKDYINGIEDRITRQNERNRYYFLIQKKFTEEQIVSAAKYLQIHGAPDNKSHCEQLMKCLIHYRQQLPFTSEPNKIGK